jgi:hypothetical protein
MSDQVQLFPEIGEVIVRLAAGRTMSEIRRDMIEHGGAESADAIIHLYSGNGTISHRTARGVAAALGTNWTAIFNEASQRSSDKAKAASAAPSPSSAPVCTRPYEFLPPEENPDAEAEADALAVRMARLDAEQLDLFGGGVAPLPAPKRKVGGWSFPSRIDVYLHLNLGSVKHARRRKASMLARALRRAGV